MQYRAAGLLFFLLVGAAGITACGGNGAGAPAGALPPATAARSGTTTPISHVIVIIQENRSFDNFFATFPGANGTMVGQAQPMSSSEQTSCSKAGQQVITTPTTLPLTEVTLTGKGFPPNPEQHDKPFGWNNDLAHNFNAGYLLECDSAALNPSASAPCRMDGFDLTKFGADGEGPQFTCTYTYQYVNPADIKPYWTMAKQYVLADDAFQTQGSESFTAHQALIAGGTANPNGITNASIIDDPDAFPWGCDAPHGTTTDLLTTAGKYEGGGPFPCLTYPNGTIRDLLDAKGIKWKFYADKVLTGRKAGGPGIWSAFDAIDAVRHGKEWGTKVTFSNKQIFTDIAAGTLPSVSWVTPDAANSDHPAELNTQHKPVDTGPSWVASLVNAIGTSKYWKSCAIVVLWDDWGGYYDHVTPPFYDNQGGLGFRFPMIVISPYVKPHVEHTQYETTSVLRFIEDNWSLGTLGQEDARATGIENAFDFNQRPRRFRKIASKYPLSFFLRQEASGYPPDTR